MTTTKSSSSSRDRSFPTLAPLTTPFVRPPSCGSGRFTTITSVDSYATLIASDPNLDSSCMPKGWDNASRIEFKPGVCPEGWTMYNLYPQGLTTGTCCSRGFTLEYHSDPRYSTDGWVCAQNLATTTTTTTATNFMTATPTATTTEVRPTLSLKVHDPWRVYWLDSDIKSLTPAPPSLDFCTEVVLKSWVPGSTVDPAARQTCPPEQPQDHLGNFLGSDNVLIWGPVLGGTVAIAFCVAICCMQRKSRRVEEPDTEQTDTEQPETEQPEANQPETNQPETNQPETNQSETKIAS